MLRPVQSPLPQPKQVWLLFLVIPAALEAVTAGGEAAA